MKLVKPVVALAAILFTLCANAAQPDLSLDSQQNFAAEAYTVSNASACLQLEVGAANADALKKLSQDLEVIAGPAAMPDIAPAGALMYSYKLVAEIRGSKLIYRGMLPSPDHPVAVRISSANQLALSEVVSKNLPGYTRAELVFVENCGQ